VNEIPVILLIDFHAVAVVVPLAESLPATESM
jgi:hypothetical protein